MFDLHVVGAGPAGSFAAITALREDKSVLLSEEHKAIGQPAHCSGLVSATGLEQMADVVDYKRIINNTITRANLHGPRERMTLSFPYPKAYVIDRTGFDEMAAQKYIDEGGKIQLGKKVERVSDLRSAHVVGADGPISTVARMFAFAPIASYSSCWQGDFAYSSPDLSAVEVFFDQSWAPGFIGWVIPTNEETAKIGLGVTKKGDLPRAKKKFLEKLNLHGTKPLSQFSALIPLSVRKKTAGIFENKYSVVLAGDAAGQVKSSSGGGIFFGASCGRLAGHLAGKPDEYERAWKHAYGADLSMHRLLRSTLDVLPMWGIDAWLMSMKYARLDRWLMQAGEMDQYSKMLSLNTLTTYAKTWLPID
ncbi:Digeranylgeranylglycerophospholipid reductase [uncultured archaeon]|nr:Digeranylgeranylglycerophospholipid reductase [uncultured archaeon]